MIVTTIEKTMQAAPRAMEIAEIFLTTSSFLLEFLIATINDRHEPEKPANYPPCSESSCHYACRSEHRSDNSEN